MEGINAMYPQYHTGYVSLQPARKYIEKPGK